MDTLLQSDTIANSMSLYSNIQVFIHGLLGVFLFMLFFIFCIKMVSYYQKKREKRNNSNH